LSLKATVQRLKLQITDDLRAGCPENPQAGCLRYVDTIVTQKYTFYPMGRGIGKLCWRKVVERQIVAEDVTDNGCEKIAAGD